MPFKLQCDDGLGSALSAPIDRLQLAFEPHYSLNMNLLTHIPMNIRISNKK